MLIFIKQFHRLDFFPKHKICLFWFCILFYKCIFTKARFLFYTKFQQKSTTPTHLVQSSKGVGFCAYYNKRCVNSHLFLVRILTDCSSFQLYHAHSTHSCEHETKATRITSSEPSTISFMG